MAVLYWNIGAPGMARGLLLRRQEVVPVNYTSAQAFRLRIEVVATHGALDAEVFLFHRQPANPVTGETLDLFLEICSVADLADYPIGAPSGTTEFPFFRTSVVELDVRSRTELETIWATIVAELNTLVSVLERFDTLTTTQEVWVGTPGEDPAPGSESASASS